MQSKRLFKFALLTGIVLLSVVVVVAGAQDDLSNTETLGKSIFFDENLSINENQSCASCHLPEWGWTGPIADINAHGAVYEGSIPGAFGDRKPPSAAYATLSPIFHMDKSGLFIGGNFWDGRATGEVLGNPAADQAQGPFLNLKEQALPDSACVVYRVCNLVDPGEYLFPYTVSFEDVYGESACDIVWPANVEEVCWPADVEDAGQVELEPEERAKSDMAYDNIALAIAAYEDSAEVNAFTSKYDQTFDGKVKLNKQEQKGYSLFRGKGMCHRCHPANGQDALFTDFSFDNLGVPVNPENPAYVADNSFRDPGLGGFLMIENYDEEIYMAEWGKQKVPTLRNVDLRPGEEDVKAYAHNGYFKSLKGIVHFYNTRDVKPTCDELILTEAEALAAECWPAPEIEENVNRDELGDLGLTPEEEDAIVAYLKTLSDGFDGSMDK